MVFAGLLLAAGAVGDRFGRRGILLAGLAVFGTAAAVALVTEDPRTLIVLRATMGAGAALVMPTTLSIITTSFPPEERARAVGVWVGIAGGGAVLGLLASGILLEFFQWSSFFGLNVVLAVLAIAGTLAVVPRSRDAEPPALDPVGAVLSLVGVSGLVFGVIEGTRPRMGRRDRPRGPRRRDRRPRRLRGVGAARLPALLDPRLFRLRGFGTGSVSLTAQFFAAFGFFFIVLQYLQYVVGRSPLEAALTMLPLPLVLIPVARRAPAIAQRLGVNRTGPLGLLLIAGGLAVISRVEVDFDYVVFVAGLVLFAAGMGLAGTPCDDRDRLLAAAVQQGVASAVNDVSREFGSAMGIAVLGSVLNDRYRSGIEGAARVAAGRRRPRRRGVDRIRAARAPRALRRRRRRAAGRRRAGVRGRRLPLAARRGRRARRRGAVRGAARSRDGRQLRGRAPARARSGGRRRPLSDPAAAADCRAAGAGDC
jgi:MFS family permease